MSKKTKLILWVEKSTIKKGYIRMAEKEFTRISHYIENLIKQDFVR